MPSSLARDYKNIRIGRNVKQVRTGVWSMRIGRSLKMRSNSRRVSPYGTSNKYWTTTGFRCLPRWSSSDSSMNMASRRITQGHVSKRLLQHKTAVLQGQSTDLSNADVWMPRSWHVEFGWGGWCLLPQAASSRNTAAVPLLPTS